MQITNVIDTLDQDRVRNTLQQPIILAKNVELLLGINDIPLLYVGEHRNYVRLNKLGADIIKQLQANPETLTRQDLANALSTRYPGQEVQIAQKLPQFLQQLHNARAITLPGAEVKHLPWGKRVLTALVRRPLLRLPLWRPNRPVAYALVRRVQFIANDVTSTLFGLWLMAALLIVGVTDVQASSTVHLEHVFWPLFVGAFLLHLTIHEFCHTLVSSYYKVKIREIGVALLYYILPVAYTDRTDGYRLRDPKERIRISLAGPAFDISAAALSALLINMTDGWVSTTFRALLLLQTTTFISNLNPLMPSDGYHALEAAVGGVNFRRRAVEIFLHRITFRPLPAYLRDLTPRQCMMHFIYALFMLAYIGLLVFIVTLMVFHIVNSIVGALHL